MKLVFPLEKGRKGLPLGTKRKYGKYWFVKTAQGWEYDGQGEKPGQKKFTKQKKPVVKGTEEEKDELKASSGFQTWFGDSKVVKKNGDPAENYSTQPLKLYHGTSHGGYRQFRVTKNSGGIYGDGIYFTEDEEVATTYTSKDDATSDEGMPKYSPRIVDPYDNEVKIKKVDLLNYVQHLKDNNIITSAKLGLNPNSSPWVVQMAEEMGADEEFSLDEFRQRFMETKINDYGVQRTPHGIDTLPKDIELLKEQMEWRTGEDLDFELPKSEVYEVYLKIENPMDMDKVLTKAETEDFLEKFQMTANKNNINFHPYTDHYMDPDERVKVLGSMKGKFDLGMAEYTYSDLKKIKKHLYEKTFDKDRTFFGGKTAKAGDPVFENLRLSGKDELTFGDVHYLMTNAMHHSQTQEYTEVVKAMGYDGIAHTGGWNIGTKQHKVWIAFDPTQIKSTKNEGTFDPENPDIFKSQHDLVILLEKGRKGLPDGTIRTYSGMKYKKVQGKWEYLGKQEKTKTEGKRKGKKKDKQGDDDKKSLLKWDIGTVPSKEFLKQEAMKGFKHANDNTLRNVAKGQIGGAFEKTLDKFDIKSLSDLYDKASEQDNQSLYNELVHGYLNNPSFINNYASGDELSAMYEIRAMVNDAVASRALSDPLWNKQLEVDGLKLDENGLKFNFVTNTGKLPDMVVGFDRVMDWVDAYITHEPSKKKIKRQIKASGEYKKWQSTGGDPKVTKAAQEFNKRTGLTAYFGSTARRQTVANPKALNEIAEIFESMANSGDINFKNYTPPDGKQLNVTIGSAGKGVAGFYTEQNQAINISPSYPGTITHEVGHYFWERHKDMRKEFMQWVKDSGLQEKLDKVLFDKLSDNEFEKHVDHTFNSSMKNVFKSINKHFPTIDNSPAAKDALHDLTAGLREQLKDEKKSMAKGYFKNLFTRISRDMNPAIADATANEILDRLPNVGRTKDEVKTNLLALSNSLKSLDRYSLEELDTELWNTYVRASQPGYRATTEHFRKKPGYWNKPTEIFARTFRNYVAYKGLGHTGNHQTGSDNDKKYGWGFPVVDPDEQMLTSNNGQLEKLLKKHLGSSVIKSMTRLAILLEKSQDDEDDDDDDEEQSERDKEFEREQKNEEAREARKSVSLVMSLSKSKDKSRSVYAKSILDAWKAKYGGDAGILIDETYVPALKSRQGLVPEQRQVTRGGKSFNMTVWVKPDDTKKTLYKRVEDMEQHFFSKTGNDYEMACAFTKDGEQIGPFTGDADSVELPETELSRLLGCEVFTHNHPLPFTFSFQDIVCCLAMGFKEIRAAHPELTSIYRPDPKFLKSLHATTKEYSNDLLDQADSIVASAVIKRKKLGPMSIPDEAIGEEMMRRLVDKIGGEFEMRDESGNVLKRFTKEDQSSEARKSMKLVMKLEKAKPYPDGTIRSHGGRKMKKVEGGWVPVTEGKTESERGGDKSRHKAEKKPMVVKGSPEVLQALKKVDRGTRVFLDDLKGKDKKTFNSLTKNGLIKWTHFADEEYVCELTEAGKNAVAKGIVTERKAKRPKNKMKR